MAAPARARLPNGCHKGDPLSLTDAQNPSHPMRLLEDLPERVPPLVTGRAL